MKLWPPMIEEYLKKFDRPPHIISIDGVGLDTELPALEYDVEEMEISFEWEGMLDAFCREFVELDRRNKASFPEGEPEEKELDTTPMGMFFNNTMSDAERDARRKKRSNLKDVRRERFAKFYRGIGQSNGMWLRSLDEEHEEEQLKKIKGF